MKPLFLLAAASLVLGTMPSTANAQAGSPGANREYIQLVQSFCSTIVGSAEYPLLNWGECMSFNVVSAEGFIAKFCGALREGAEGGYEAFGFEDYDDCIRNLEF